MSSSKLLVAMIRNSTALVCAALIAVMAGCGGNEFGPMGSVSGKLTLDGKTLPAGTKVIFMEPENGYMGFGITDDAGNYRIEWRRSGTTYDGLPVGNYQVTLVPAGAVDIDEVSAEDMLAGGPKQPKPSVAIPPKLLRGATSGLAYDVAANENVINIEAVSK